MGSINTTGMTMRIVPQTTYTFDKLQRDRMQAIYIAQHIDVGPFQRVDLAVRAHSATFDDPGCSIAILAVPDGWTEEDPAAIFLDMSRSVSDSITLTSAYTYPLYSVKAITAGFGRLLTVVVLATQPNVAPPLSCRADISVDLILKEGDPSGIGPSFNTYRGYRGQ